MTGHFFRHTERNKSILLSVSVHTSLVFAKCAPRVLVTTLAVFMILLISPRDARPPPHSYSHAARTRTCTSKCRQSTLSQRATWSSKTPSSNENLGTAARKCETAEMQRAWCASYVSAPPPPLLVHGKCEALAQPLRKVGADLAVASISNSRGSRFCSSGMMSSSTFQSS